MLKKYILAAALTVLGGVPVLAADLPQLAAVASPSAALGGDRGVQLTDASNEETTPLPDLVALDDAPDDADLDQTESTELMLPDDLPDSDLPLTFNNKVEFFIRSFQGSSRASFARWLSRSERYIPMMKKVLRDEKLPEDLVYLAMIESGFSPHAFSVASAVGPWQFMSATGKRYSLRIDQWIDERRDPLKSTVAAAMYLKELYGMFNNDWYLAAAGYNAGENKILRAINMYNSRDFWQLSKGEYLKRETKDYVPKLVAAAIVAKDPARYGFAEVAYLPPVEFDTVKIPSRTDLEVVAKLIQVRLDDLRFLNPELRRSCTPPGYPNYELKIPNGTKALFEAEYAKLPEDQRYVERVHTAHYRATKRDTLASIARRFHTTPQVLAELNGIRPKERRLRGRVLVVPLPAPVQVAAAAAPAANAAPQPKAVTVNRYYTVKKGDTLFALAKRFNVTTRILAAWNNLKTMVALRPGKRLIVAKVEREG